MPDSERNLSDWIFSAPTTRKRRSPFLRSLIVGLLALAFLVIAIYTIRRYYTAKISTMTTRCTPESETLKDYGNRCEGIVGRPNALKDFSLLSVMVPGDPIPHHSVMKVRLFLPTSSRLGKRVFLEAQEKEDFYHYFMSAKTAEWRSDSWITFEPWPTSAVIDELQLLPNNIAVRAGYITVDSVSVYIPVEVFTDKPPLTLKPYQFVFVTGQPLQSVDVATTDSAGRDVTSLKTIHLSCDLQADADCTLFPAGSNVSFDLDMTAVPDGQYHVLISGHVPRLRKETGIEVLIYHKLFPVNIR